MSQEQFKRSMDYYQQQYFEVTVELRSQDPTLEQYQNQIMQENENIDYSNRTIGARNDSIVAGSYQELDSYGHIKEDLGDENLEEIADITQDYANTSQEVVGDMIKEAKLALMNGDIQKATEIIESAEGLSFGREVSKRDSDENAISENDEQLKEGMEQNDEQNEYSNNSFMQEMESGVADEKEAQLQERLRILEENYNKDIEDAQIEQNNLDKTMVRTRFNKKTN